MARPSRIMAIQPGVSELGWLLLFVNKADLAASGCLKDDCLVIKCTVRVITSKLNDDDDDSFVAPPSDLGRDLGYLLENVLKTDLTVRIGWFRSFEVHACMLAARSPVFQAQLCGAMMESRQSTIRIKDMDAKVFEVLLHYIYNDCLPEFMEETTELSINMTQHLLGAADRYAIDRLKLICEGKLGKALDVNTVGFTLDLAEQYHCQLLKDYCLKYMVRDSERLRAIVKTSGFEQLKQNHPLIACEILHKVIDKL
ncbi:BTB/POZ and MATH domain-containing protein 1-like [Aegilops tauschii subsp. strangulata]|uniref:BTB/POZ and MATH domain-containing protein 1-like n=1 Tax=Aegilops tauschii subsp. strangulata TaxID=200361 RepID=UPI00098AF384|nr:BTB/POZ and MATH domain-containing protein 1-like [Aegilops tauschii subsp. strangulata]